MSTQTPTALQRSQFAQVIPVRTQDAESQVYSFNLKDFAATAREGDDDKEDEEDGLASFHQTKLDDGPNQNIKLVVRPKPPTAADVMNGGGGGGGGGGGTANPNATTTPHSTGGPSRMSTNNGPMNHPMTGAGGGSISRASRPATMMSGKYGSMRDQQNQQNQNVAVQTYDDGCVYSFERENEAPRLATLPGAAAGLLRIEAALNQERFAEKVRDVDR